VLTPPRYRPLGDADNLSLKEAAEILGKAHSTVYLWHRQGKLPPAVDVGPHLHVNKPVIVVPRYRLEAWLAGERMLSILQDVFDRWPLHRPGVELLPSRSRGGKSRREQLAP
jgi:transposase